MKYKLCIYLLLFPSYLVANDFPLGKYETVSESHWGVSIYFNYNDKCYINTWESASEEEAEWFELDEMARQKGLKPIEMPFFDTTEGIACKWKLKNNKITITDRTNRKIVFIYKKELEHKDFGEKGKSPGITPDIGSGENISRGHKLWNRLLMTTEDNLAPKSEIK